MKIKPFEELQDYKVKNVLETEMLQDSVWREGLQDYKRGRIEPRTWELNLELEPQNWTLILDLSSVFKVCHFIDEMNHGKSSKVTWVS